MDEPIEIREAKVTYTTKELLARIDGRMERLEHAVMSAATRAELERLEARVTHLEDVRQRQERLEQEVLAVQEVTERMETFIAHLEAVRAHKAAVFTRREKIVGGMIAAAALAGQLMLLAANHLPI